MPTTKKKPDLRLKLIDAAMAIAAGQGWPAVTMPAAAARAKVDAAAALEVFATPADILLHIINFADAAAAPADAGPVRDQLFEAAMARFDALAPWRDGLAAVEAAKAHWPKLACALLPALHRSARLTLTQAGVSTDGPVGQLRGLAWLLVKADVARVWFGDDSPDLGATMAALDRRLVQLEKVAAWRLF